jgi:hypothetical protein
MFLPSGVKIRMVVNYSSQNKFLKRPVTLFSTTQMIRENLQIDSRYYAALDLVQGYHQQGLHRSSRDFTAFLIPHGHLRIRKLLMGLSTSRDIFNTSFETSFQTS